MTLDVTYLPTAKTSRLRILIKTKQFIKDNTNNKISNLPKTIIVNKRNVVLYYDENNTYDIEFLRKYVQEVFNGETIGIIKDNEITSNLKNIRVVKI